MNTAESVIQEAIERHAKECCGHLDMDGRAAELLAELERRGWKLVQIDPFAAADPPPGCCGGWVGPNGQRTMCCPVASPGPTNAPAIGGADAEPGDLVLTRQGVLDAFAERLTKIEDWIDRQDEGWRFW